MEAELFNPFISSTVNVLRTMAATELKVGKIGKKKDSLTAGVVSGLIGLTSSTVSGDLVLSFDRPSILGIVGRMLLENYEEINDQVVDAVGEITNIICGGAKTELEQKGLIFGLATPRMIRGEAVEIPQFTGADVMTVPFQTQDGWFVVEAGFAPAK